MKMEETTIPARIAHLIILYLDNRLSVKNRKELDAWVCASDENMELFEELTLDADDNVFDPDDVIADTENIIDLWVVAGLIVRHQRRLNNEIEESYLNEWATSTPERRKLFKKLQHPKYMQKMLVWNKMKRIEMELFR